MDAKLDKYISDLIINANRLQYESKTGWKSCPEWAVYLIKLGVVFGTQKRGIDPFLGIVSVPERSFAASFLGAGIVMGRALVPNYETENEERVTQLLSLGKGTSVVLRNDDRKFKGQFMKVAETHGGKYLCIKVEKGTERYIPFQEAYRIEIIGKKDIKLPKNQKGNAHSDISSLLEGLIPSEFQNDFQLRTSLQVVVSGPKKRLLQEIENVQLCIPKGDKCTKRDQGSLVDLLRPMTMGQRGSAYRTRFVASGNSSIGQTLMEMKPFAFVIDGSLALIKWGGLCRHSHRIAILDRTEAQYDEGIEFVNNLFINERTQDTINFELPTPPIGVTVSAFPVRGGAR